ncbi:MAG TPA: hypothetical protein VIF62_27155 [Labilithrix sp.]
MLARMLGLSTFVVAVAAIGCSTSNGDPGPVTPGDPQNETSSSLCSDARAWKDKCTDSKPSACDATIIGACSDVTGLLNPSLVSAAASCVEGADCKTAPTSCLAKSIASAKPTDAHKKLAQGLCGCLLTGSDACIAAIDSNSGPAKAALAIAVPLSDDVANAITDACTTTPGCSATFSACAQGVIAKKAAEKLSPDAAECLAKSILDAADGKGAAPSGGDSSCTPKTCEDLGGKCGDHDDGCGGTVSCGACKPACTPKTCAQLGKTCGTAPDGCGGTASCGTCPSSCKNDAHEPNDSQAGATALAAMQDSPDSSNTVDSLVLADGDEDWFLVPVADTGFDGNPRIEATVGADYEIGVFYVCDAGGDASYCPDGATQDDTIGMGCRGTRDVALKTSCSGIDESGKTWIRVRKTASDGMCSGYTLTIVVQ